MEAHLIGEEVEVDDLADVDVEAADADVVGHRTEDGVGAEGGRRRQIRYPAAYPVDQRIEAAVRYAAAGMETLPVHTVISMTAAQHARYASVQTQSGVWMQREAELCDALNSVVEGRPAKAVEAVVPSPMRPCSRMYCVMKASHLFRGTGLLTW